MQRTVADAGSGAVREPVDGPAVSQVAGFGGASGAKTPYPVPQRPEAAFARCIGLLDAADPRAGPMLQDLLRDFPTHAAGWEELGSWLLKAGKNEAALVCLRRAAAVSPAAGVSLALGQALRNLGRLDEARAAFATACRLAPASARAAFLLGLCAQDARDHALARASYERALAIDPTLAEAWINLGTVLQEGGDLDGAKRAYRAGLRRRPDGFGRVSQALASSPRGEVWLDLRHLRHDLTG